MSVNERITLARAHSEWAAALDRQSAAGLREYAERIISSADRLGIWRRGGRVPLQPFIVSAACIREMERVGVGLVQLLVRHALERCGGDLRRLGEQARLSADFGWVAGSRRPLADALASARPDVFIVDGRPRILEINFGTCLNGVGSTPALESVMLSSTIGGALRDQYALVAPSVFSARAAWVAEATVSSARLALIGAMAEGDEGSLRVFEDEVAVHRRMGLSCDFVPLEEAEIEDGILTWEGNEYPIALRYFLLGSKAESSRRSLVRALEAAPRTRLLGSCAYQIFTSKALLADLVCDPNLSASERALVDHVPWTARLRQQHVRRRNEVVDPVEWAREHREQAIFKPINGAGSRGILMGPLTDETTWQDALERALLDDDTVVQEVVDPDPWPCRYWDMVTGRMIAVTTPPQLGPLLVNESWSGCYVRQASDGGAEEFLTPGRVESLNCVVGAERAAPG